MELQLLKNVPCYKRSYWTFPCFAIDRQINRSFKWIAFLLLFGKTAIGVRIYYAFAKNTEQANQPDSGE
jgi:cellobiose-specific phosphotransferase system component IIC